VLFYRHFKSRIEDYLVDMEDEAQKLLDTLFSGRGLAPSPQA
jgi:hypothetical protein